MSGRRGAIRANSPSLWLRYGVLVASVGVALTLKLLLDPLTNLRKRVVIPAVGE